ncbi:MAG: 4Fe-4S binding protein [Clostridiales Family XIII bacterium]|jgi:epoxyqueuosine reductase QueG|nr:4Fe-4S binding protein [Clostridiales Family XIII bacterium]
MLDFLIAFEGGSLNTISEDVAKSPAYAGKRLYEGAICGVAAADDAVIVSLKANKEANLDMTQPEEWLPGAKSVLSFFLPFARWIPEENAGGDWPSDGWLHGRIEGQAFSSQAIAALAGKIREAGYGAVVPSLDPRLKVFMKYAGYPESLFTVNWSERHIAFAAGLGTFGLSRGIITEKGMAGRFMSIVTTLPLVPTPRPYSDLLEYCVKCGACIRNCPPQAITVERLKDHKLCDEYLVAVRKKEEPYYGCGKCQSGVPCASRIPGRG